MDGRKERKEDTQQHAVRKQERRWRRSLSRRGQRTPVSGGLGYDVYRVTCSPRREADGVIADRPVRRPCASPTLSRATCSSLEGADRRRW